MGRLIYSMLASLDGYVSDEHGRFEWGAPDEEVHSFINDLQRPASTHLYGRRMYETMAVWDDPSAFADEPAVVREYGGIWRAADKIVYSRSLTEACTGRTRIEREFDAGAVRSLKESLGHDLSIGGPDIAGEALRAGLVDELGLFVVPVLVGAGAPWLPAGLRLRLEPLQVRRFTSGIVYLRYGVAAGLDHPPFEE